MRGHHEHVRAGLLRPQPFEDLEPAPVGEAEVEQRQIGGDLREEALSLRGGGGEVDDVVDLLKRSADVLREHLFILDHQKCGHGSTKA